MDTYDGSAWVRPHAVRHGRGAPAGVARGPAPFAETNLRTYVRGPDGRDGLWFLSIEVACR
ncbi:DUF2071 domain-containing protein [Streptomyces tricolor]|nr:DUF2071 domain-containing protein [Streptomyces tricolor]